MFKKGFKIQNSTLVKTSEKKRLRDVAQRSFPRLSYEQLDFIMPAKSQVAVTKVGGSHTLVYVIDGQPIFIDSDGRGNDLIPTGDHLDHWYVSYDYSLCTLEIP
jgi:hypothetical protein